MRNLAWAAVLAAGLTACSGGQGDNDKPGEGGSMGSSADIETTVPAAGGGSFTVKEGVSQDVVLPLGLAKMDGAKFKRAGDVNRGGGQTGAQSIEMEAPGSIADVMAFYKAELARSGVENPMDMNIDGKGLISGSAPGGGQITVVAEPGTTAGTVKVHVQAIGVSP